MISKALIAASTKPIILSTLLGRKSYGYQIIQRVKDISGGTLDWSEVSQWTSVHATLTKLWKPLTASDRP